MDAPDVDGEPDAEAEQDWDFEAPDPTAEQHWDFEGDAQVEPAEGDEQVEEHSEEEEPAAPGPLSANVANVVALLNSKRFKSWGGRKLDATATDALRTLPESEALEQLARLQAKADFVKNPVHWILKAVRIANEQSGVSAKRPRAGGAGKGAAPRKKSRRQALREKKAAEVAEAEPSSAEDDEELRELLANPSKGKGKGKGKGKDKDKGKGKEQERARQVILSGFGTNIDKGKLWEFAEQVGPVHRVDIFFDRETGESKGRGKAEYSSELDAKKAIKKLTGQELDGCRVVARPQTQGGGKGDKKGKPQDTLFHVFFSGMNYETTEEAFRQFAESAGHIVHLRLFTNRETGESKGCGKVEYETEEEAAAAVEQLNGAELDGRSVYAKQPALEVPAEPTEKCVLDQVENLHERGIVLNQEAVTALCDVDLKTSLAILQELSDRGQTVAENGRTVSGYVIESVERAKKKLCSPALFKLRFLQALQKEEGKKGKKGKKGKGKDKDKDKEKA